MLEKTMPPRKNESEIRKKKHEIYCKIFMTRQILNMSNDNDDHGHHDLLVTNWPTWTGV